MVEWMFDSVAVLVTISNASSLTTWVEIVGNVGATFTSRTMTVKEFVEARLGLTRSYGLLLVTIVVKVLVPGLCNWLGVQVMMPLVSMLAPTGGLTSA